MKANTITLSKNSLIISFLLFLLSLSLSAQIIMPVNSDTSYYMNELPLDFDGYTSITTTNWNVPFEGQLAVDPVTRMVSITDAKPSGNYAIFVTATAKSGEVYRNTTMISVFAKESVGIYPKTTLIAGGSIKIQPEAPLVNVGYAIATCINFPGTLTVNHTGEIMVTNAKVPGIYTIQVSTIANNPANNNPAARGITTFELEVINPLCNQGFDVGKKTISVANKPQDVYVGDFNNDGFQDFWVTGGEYSSSMAIGDGNGNFTIKQQYFSANGYNSMAFEDFSGDGIVDIVLANQQVGGLSATFYKGLGLGTFALGQNVDYNVFSHGDMNLLATGDFRNEGKLDFIYASSMQTLYRNVGYSFDGQYKDFQATYGNMEQTHPLFSGTPVYWVMTDFNGDGNEDVVVSKYYAGLPPNNQTLALLAGNGEGRLTEVYSYAEPVGYLEAADFNKDGFQDIIKVTSAGIKVLFGNGSAFTRSVASVFPELSLIKETTELLDFNGDGFLDILIATSKNDENGVVLLQGDGLGNFTVNSKIPVTSKVRAFGVGDFNRDGRQDFVVVNDGEGIASVTLGSTPQISVRGNELPIYNRDNTPSETDFTDFGVCDTRNNLFRNFYINNTGTGYLAIQKGQFVITGTDSALFTVNDAIFPVFLAPDSSFSFPVIFNPSDESGLKKASIHIKYDECANKAHVFDVQARVTDAFPLTLGEYSGTRVFAGENSTVASAGVPSSIKVVEDGIEKTVAITQIMATTSTNFTGLFSVDTQTGDIRITNAGPAGTYQVKVKGFLEEEKWYLDTSASDIESWTFKKKTELISTDTKTFELTVEPPNCSDGVFALAHTYQNIGMNPQSVVIADFNQDNIQDFILTYSDDALPAFEFGKLPGLTGASIQVGGGNGDFIVADKGLDLIVGFDPRAIKVDDYNGDGLFDIAVANSDPIGNVFTRVSYGGYLIMRCRGWYSIRSGKALKTETFSLQRDFMRAI